MPEDCLGDCKACYLCFAPFPSLICNKLSYIFHYIYLEPHQTVLVFASTIKHNIKLLKIKSFVFVNILLTMYFLPS